MTEPRRRSTLKIVLIVLAVVLVVCCGGGGAGFSFFLDNLTKEPKAAAAGFLDELQQNTPGDAYDQLCSSVKTATSREDMINRYSDKVGSYDMEWGGSYDNTNGRETATVSADVTLKAGGDANWTFEVVKEGGAWRVCSLP